MEEQWKSYGKYYRVSNYGEVYSEKSGRLLKQTPNTDGYLKTSLIMEDSTRKSFFVHRLVAILFIHNPENNVEVNHKDGNKTNNKYFNLEWCTHSENLQHAWDNKLMKHSETGLRNIVEGSIIPIQCIETEEIFPSMTEAAKHYNISKTGISAQINGKQKTAGKHKQTGKGLTWKKI